AVSDLNSYVDRLELDPESLERAEQRVGALFSAARKFHVEPEDLPALREQLAAQLSASEAATDLEALRTRVSHTAAAYHAVADRLGQARRTVAKRLTRDVTAAMQELAMQGGAFQVELSPCRPGAHGKENIESHVAGHAGTPLRTLGKVASGG